MSRLGAVLGVLHRGVTVPTEMGAAEPGLLRPLWDVPGFFSSDLALPDPSLRAGWPWSFGRALAALWLILAHSGSGEDGWEQMLPTLWRGSDLQSTTFACGMYPLGTLGLAGPLPRAGKLVL